MIKLQKKICIRTYIYIYTHKISMIKLQIGLTLALHVELHFDPIEKSSKSQSLLITTTALLIQL